MSRHIEAFADVTCPFAHVGLRTVARRRAETGHGDVALRVRAWPLELVNGAPLDPSKVAHHIDAIREQIAPDLFTGFNPSLFPRTSLPALALAAAAYRHGDSAGEAMSLALRDALFEHGRDISDEDVLADIGTAFGVTDRGPGDHEAVMADYEEGTRRGVRGSPHFFCGGAEAFCPSLEITRDEEGHMLLRRSAAEIDAFLEGCFA